MTQTNAIYTKVLTDPQTATKLLVWLLSKPCPFFDECSTQAAAAEDMNHLSMG